MNRKILKTLWKLHWALNIAPNFNGQGGKMKTYYVDNWGYRFDETHPYWGSRIKNKGLEEIVRRNRPDRITKYSPTQPIYSINLSEMVDNLKIRLKKITAHN